jgi:cation diffusion facilitator family transporter
MDKNKLKIQIIAISFFISLILMVIKFIAYFITNSNSILTDALESIINVAATGFAYYSLNISAKPKDFDHPYGHGKIEFFASGFEGGLIIIAGFTILYKGLYAIFQPSSISQLDWGIYLIAFTAIVNYFLGNYLIIKGKELNTEVLIADGKHLQTDTYSTVILVIGLLVMYFTNYNTFDSYLSIVMAVWVIYNGVKTIRPAIGGLMDETDIEIVEKVIVAFNKYRKPVIIDIHNLRIQKYGSELHIDCHITLPFYLSLADSHQELKSVENFLKNELGLDLEIFIHADPCVVWESCKICTLENCAERKIPFEKTIKWDLENLISNKKHSV